MAFKQGGLGQFADLCPQISGWARSAGRCSPLPADKQPCVGIGVKAVHALQAPEEQLALLRQQRKNSSPGGIHVQPAAGNAGNAGDAGNAGSAQDGVKRGGTGEIECTNMHACCSSLFATGCILSPQPIALRQWHQFVHWVHRA